MEFPAVDETTSVFSARLVVTWPPIYDRKFEVVKAFIENQEILRYELQRRVVNYLGSDFRLAWFRHETGSLEILLGVAAASFVAIRDYKNLRQSITYLVRDMAGLVGFFFRTHMSGAQQSMSAYQVQSTWQPLQGLISAPSESEESALTTGKGSPPGAAEHRALLSHPVLWYLLVTNAALVGFVIWLAASRL